MFNIFNQDENNSVWVKPSNKNSFIYKRFQYHKALYCTVQLVGAVSDSDAHELRAREQCNYSYLNAGYSF